MMKMRLVALLLPPILCAQTNSGLAASFSDRGIQYLVNQLIPQLQKEFGQISIPDLPFDADGFEGTVSSIKCDNFQVGSGTAVLTPPSSLGGSLGGIAVSCNANWDFKLKSWPHVPSGSGSADISVSGTSATVSVPLAVNASSGHATMSCPTGCADISIGSIDVTFHGSLWDWLLNLLKGMLSDTIKASITSAFSSTIATMVNTQGNSFLADIPTALPLALPAPYNITEARFGLTQAPAVTAGYAGVYLQGDIVPIAAPVPPAGVPAPDLPPFCAAAAASYVQLLLSPYLLMTAAGTYVEAGLDTLPVPPSSLPLGFNLTSSPSWSTIAPGMAGAYPPGTPVGIQAGLQGIPQVVVTASQGVAVDAPVTLSFLAYPSSGSSEAFVLSAAVSLSLDLHLQPVPADNGTLITGNLTYLAAPISLVNSSIGTVQVALLSDVVSLLLSDVLLPAVNALLAAGLPLPPAPGLQLVQPQILYQDGYVLLHSNFTFTPPGSTVAPAPGRPVLALERAPAGVRKPRWQ